MDFNNTGAMRSPFSPRVRQSISGRRAIGQTSAKKNQGKFVQPLEQGGDVIYKTPLITVETYGMPLPVMVTEAVTFSSGDISVRLSPCGWCWVVTGRRILAWPYSPASGESGSPAPAGTLAARELTLPQTDLSHKADLVMLFYEDGSQMPSCIGVSPEGVVRYWGSVGQETYVDVSCELAGQECDRLVHAAGQLVLATTTCTLVVLEPTLSEGRSTVSCRTLRPPSGWLGGIGRRVSHLFFGSMPAHADTRLVGVVGVGDTVALVAGGPVLQLWHGAELREHSLRRPLQLAHHHHGEPSTLEVSALDVHSSGEHRIVMLIASGHSSRMPDVRYSIAHISVEDMDNPRVESVIALRAWPAEGDEPPRLLPLGTHALVYTSAYIALVSASASNEPVEYLSVSGEGDRMVGAAACAGRALLFSRKHGLLLLTPAVCAPHPHTSVCESPMGSPCPSDMYEGNLSLYEIDPNEINCGARDACGTLKTAFLFHVRRDIASCRKLLGELVAGAAGDVDAALDRTVLAVATQMLDDMPAGDPRWKSGSGAATNICLGSSTALQVAAQLQDKKRAFTLFLDFLRAHHLVQRLGDVSAEGGGCQRTESALRSLAECLAAAAALRALQRGPHAQLIDAAIYQVVCGSESEEEAEVEAALSSGALSPSDACYRRVSRVRRVLVAVARSRPGNASEPATAARRAHSQLQVLARVLSDVHTVRAQWRLSPSPPPASPPAPHALLPACRDLLVWAVTECAHKCPDMTVRGQVLEEAGTLAILLLEEAAPLKDNPETARIYRQLRRDLIAPFMAEKQMERAARLAEKFRDFTLLVELCVETDDWQRLQQYIDTYAQEGMAETAYAWLSSRGGRLSAELVRRLSGPRLAAWLAASPERTPLAVLHRLCASELGAAAALLADMAEHHTRSVKELTTISSLGKLCICASDQDTEAEREQADTLWRRLETRLALAEQHEALPRDLRRTHGLDEQDSPVLPPEELVQMYIDCQSPTMSEYDYKKALDLTDYIDDMERRDDLRLRIWCACILRSDWSTGGEASPEALQDKMFFRLVDLVNVMGGDLEVMLPPLDDILTARELSELVSDARAHYLLRYGYDALISPAMQ